MSEHNSTTPQNQPEKWTTIHTSALIVAGAVIACAFADINLFMGLLRSLMDNPESAFFNIFLFCVSIYAVTSAVFTPVFKTFFTATPKPQENCKWYDEHYKNLNNEDRKLFNKRIGSSLAFATTMFIVANSLTTKFSISFVSLANYSDKTEIVRSFFQLAGVQFVQCGLIWSIYAWCVFFIERHLKIIARTIGFIERIKAQKNEIAQAVKENS